LVPAVAAALGNTVLAFWSIKKLGYPNPLNILAVELSFLLYGITIWLNVERATMREL
jgi:hypothetical protein